MHNKCFRLVTNIRDNDVVSVTCWNLNVLFYSLYQEKQGHKKKSCSMRSKADFITYTFVTKEFNFKNVLWSNRERERNVSLHSFGSCSYIERSLSNHILQRNSTTWVTWYLGRSYRSSARVEASPQSSGLVNRSSETRAVWKIVRVFWKKENTIIKTT